MVSLSFILIYSYSSIQWTIFLFSLEYTRRVELIQDFEFPESSQQVLFTPDENHILCSGEYQPQIKLFDTYELSCKWARHTKSLTLKLACLEQDWTKLLLLQADRSLEFHHQGGFYFSTRIPKVINSSSKEIDSFLSIASSNLFLLFYSLAGILFMTVLLVILSL